MFSFNNNSALRLESANFLFNIPQRKARKFSKNVFLLTFFLKLKEILKKNSLNVKVESFRKYLNFFSKVIYPFLGFKNVFSISHNTFKINTEYVLSLLCNIIYNIFSRKLYSSALFISQKTTRVLLYRF